MLISHGRANVFLRTVAVMRTQFLWWTCKNSGVSGPVVAAGDCVAKHTEHLVRTPHADEKAEMRFIRQRPARLPNVRCGRCTVQIRAHLNWIREGNLCGGDCVITHQARSWLIRCGCADGWIHSMRICGSVILKCANNSKYYECGVIGCNRSVSATMHVTDDFRRIAHCTPATPATNHISNRWCVFLLYCIRCHSRPSCVHNAHLLSTDNRQLFFPLLHYIPHILT